MLGVYGKLQKTSIRFQVRNWREVFRNDEVIPDKVE